jgi:hypothetical protein
MSVLTSSSGSESKRRVQPKLVCWLLLDGYSFGLLFYHGGSRFIRNVDNFCWTPRPAFRIRRQTYLSTSSAGRYLIILKTGLTSMRKNYFSKVSIQPSICLGKLIRDVRLPRLERRVVDLIGSVRRNICSHLKEWKYEYVCLI